MKFIGAEYSMDKSRNEIFYHYCIVRNDLPIGVTAAQLVHAAGESNPGGQHSHAVVLGVPKENLLDIEVKLSDAGITHVAVREPDSPYNGELMAIGIVPVFRSKNKDLRRIVSGLKLLR